jgi:hypothetical protein
MRKTRLNNIHCIMQCLIAVSHSRHPGHDTENVVVHGIDTDLSSVHTRHSVGGKNELKDGIVNSGEIAATRRLVLLGAEGKGVHIDTAIGGTCVMLERLDNIEVRTLTLGEAILAVKLELSGNNGILTPTMHVESGFTKNESSSVRCSSGTRTTNEILEDITRDGNIGLGSGLEGVKGVG